MTLFNGITIKLDKNNPDSDGDGLYDGEEVVELNYQYNEDKTQVIVTGKLLSDPLNADTDGDGLTDEEEIYYYGTDPFKADTDGDGLTDSLEIELWFDPLQADADGDGRLDLQEYQEGTSPFNYDKDWYEYVWDFLCGLIAGDFLREVDSVAVVLGQVISGLVPIADARDVIANLTHGDWGFAGLSAIGLVPVAGDVTKTGSKIGKFILKNIDNAPKVANVLTFMTKNFPDITKELSKSDEFVDAIKQLSKSDTSKLTYRPGATVGDGGTAAILVDEFNNGTSKHLQKATERLKQLQELQKSGQLGLNDLDIVEALIEDLEYAIGLFN